MFCLIFIVSFSFANRTVVEILRVLLQQLVVLLQLGWKTEKKTGNWELKPFHPGKFKLFFFPLSPKKHTFIL